MKAAQVHLERHLNFIGGQPVAPSGGEFIDMLCPSDGVAFAQIARGTKADMDEAVVVARKAFDQGPWPRTAALDRSRVLARMSALILRDREALADLEARDVGKIRRSTHFDVTTLARYFEYYAGAVDKFGGEQIPFEDGTLAFTMREPLGVVAAILPWNSPTQMFGRVVSPALAMGNTVVIKPAEDACLTILWLARLLIEAGLPEGALNVVTGYGHEAGAALSSHPDIDFISFTGSPEVGAMVQAAAAVNHVGVTLELGGKSPQILFADADFSKAMPVIVTAIIANSGQTCVAGSRLLVQESCLDRVRDLFSDHMRGLRAGAHDVECDLGPLINEKQMRRVKTLIEGAKADGVPVLSTGGLAEGTSDGGFFVPPTLIGPVPRQNRLARTEIFGPVLSLLPFKDEADAIALANDTPYGLGAGIWTADIGRALRVARAVRSGQVYINSYGAGGGVQFPFGGFKKSGHGREKGLEALREFSATKTIVINHS